MYTHTHIYIHLFNNKLLSQVKREKNLDTANPKIKNSAKLKI